MQSCRTLSPAVYKAQQKFNMLCAFALDDSRSATEIAGCFGYSAASLYRIYHATIEALTDRPPGPAAHASGATSQRTAAECRTLTAFSARESQRPSIFSSRLCLQVTLEMTVRGLPLRGLECLFELLGEPAGASRSSLAETIVRLGNHARNLLCMTRDHLARSLNVLSGDEIFFHGQAIKVLLDPCSSAVVDVMRWPWRGSDEWALFLEPFSALRLFVTDDGADLRGANTGDVWLGADMFHERQWWNKVVFTPLDRREKALASELEKLRKRSDPSESYDHARRMKIARTEQDRQRVEALFYVGVEIEARLLTLFEPLDPAGARWDVDAIYAEILWATEQCSRLGASLGARVCKHIERRTPQYAGHHRLWDLVNVEFLPGATWSREQVLDALIRRRKLRAAEHHPERSNYERWRAHERRTALDSELSAQISNPDEAAAQVKRLLKTPARSSSLVETFNSRLRVLQTSRRNVSDALLWLCALHWNLSRRENGPRKHQSPWQQLGLIAQNDMRSWAEILLDMMPE